MLVQHLDPLHPSLLPHLLSSKTAMPVSEATEGAEIAGDHVYVVPPHADILTERGCLRLRPRDADVQPHLPIDTFLRSLAEDKGERAIGVVLSGAASDGTQGLAAIKSGGGVTFAQELTCCRAHRFDLGRREGALVACDREVAAAQRQAGHGEELGDLGLQSLNCSPE